MIEDRYFIQKIYEEDGSWAKSTIIEHNQLDYTYATRREINEFPVLMDIYNIAKKKLEKNVPMCLLGDYTTLGTFELESALLVVRLSTGCWNFLDIVEQPELVELDVTNTVKMTKNLYMFDDGDIIVRFNTLQMLDDIGIFWSDPSAPSRRPSGMDLLDLYRLVILKSGVKLIGGSKRNVYIMTNKCCYLLDTSDAVLEFVRKTLEEECVEIDTDFILA